MTGQIYMHPHPQNNLIKKERINIVRNLNSELYFDCLSLSLYDQFNVLSFKQYVEIYFKTLRVLFALISAWWS